MRILVVGATGTIGHAVVAALQGDHDVVPVSRKSAPVSVDIESPESIVAMYRKVGALDAVVSAAGQRDVCAPRRPDGCRLHVLARQQADGAGQSRAIRHSRRPSERLLHAHQRSSWLARPWSGARPSVSSTPPCGGLARAAALEAPQGIRCNVVSPPWVIETLKALGMDPSHGLPAATVARAYVQSITGNATGAVIDSRA